jgi:AraC-like DNA-binding protein
MTKDDNPLTMRATDTAPREPLTYPANDLRIFLLALHRLGYHSERLLKAARLPASALNDPDGRIPCEVFGAVIGGAMQERPMKNLGVRVAAETPIGAFPLLDYLVLTSNSVGQGVRQLARYFKLENTPTTFDIREDRDLIEVAVWCVDTRFSPEFTVAIMVLNLRQETEQRFRAESVSFAHTPDDAAEIQQILGCPVRAPETWSGVTISRKAWQLPFRRRDPVLRSLLERQADEIIAQMPAAEGVIYGLRRALARRVVGGDTRISAVARDLATTPRTLQRRLTEAGLSYQEVLDMARREAVEKYLANSALSIGEVAYLLGYSEPSAFHRAFKRWNGVTPQAFREKRGGANLNSK